MSHMTKGYNAIFQKIWLTGFGVLVISRHNMKVQLRVQPLLVHSPDGQSAAGAILIRVLVLILILILLLTGSPTNPFNISTAEAGQASSPDLAV